MIVGFKAVNEFEEVKDDLEIFFENINKTEEPLCSFKNFTNNMNVMRGCNIGLIFFLVIHFIIFLSYIFINCVHTFKLKNMALWFVSMLVGIFVSFIQFDVITDCFSSEAKFKEFVKIMDVSTIILVINFIILSITMFIAICLACYLVTNSNDDV